MGIPQINIEFILQVIIALTGAFFLAFWVGLIVWTFRDARSRSRDIFVQLLSTLMVVFFNVPGLLLYFILRPPETLAEVYERALEEEALLKDIEERLICPGCKRQVQKDFLICPTCHTRLKKACPSCGQLLHLKWNICPYCGASPSTPPVRPPAMVKSERESVFSPLLKEELSAKEMEILSSDETQKVPAVQTEERPMKQAGEHDSEHDEDVDPSAETLF
ncbi:MAG: double zinc ribbon domain-containing protein [Anaerolineae bacterium]